MAKFSIKVREVNFGGVIVEAETAEEAYDKVYDAYEAGKIFWDAGDFDIVNCETL